MAFLIVFAVVLILLLAYLFCLKGRAGHEGLIELRRWDYAHRGLHDKDKPENSMVAFRAAKDGGFGIELDIHLMKDGNLAVIHDSSLKRTAGADVRIEDLTLAELDKYRLGGTQEKIPLFSEVLELFDGAAPLIVELKTTKENYRALCQAAYAMLDKYSCTYCIESFDPRCIRYLRKHRPEIVRGQLSENWFKGKSKLPFAVKFVMAFHISNVFTRPDFIAYHFKHRKAFGTDLCRKLWRVQGVAWTLRSREDFDTAKREGWIAIFEGFVP